MAGKKTKNTNRTTQGEETRATLLAVGSRLFARNGYDGVSMRTLAAEAGVNLATVSYHFGGKPGLYQAIMEQLITVRDTIFPTADEVRARLAETGEDVRARGAATDWFVSRMVHGMLGHSEYAWATLILARELAQPSRWYDMLAESFFNPSFEALCALVSGVDREATREDVVLTAHGLIAIVTKLLEAHAVINQRLGWHGFADHMDTLDAIVKKRIRGLLGLPMEEA